MSFKTQAKRFLANSPIALAVTGAAALALVAGQPAAADDHSQDDESAEEMSERRHRILYP